MAGDLAAFRAEVRDWLAANLTDELREVAAKSTSVFVDKPHTLKWQAILHKQGWVAPTWPKEYGGTGWSEAERHVFASECALAGAPALSPMGLRMVAPAIMHYGTAEQNAWYLPRILSGEDYWCQGYSEPGAGSDLASLSLRAERDGDHYVLNGCKIWTTHAHFANKMFCLVRTSRDGRPQQGITFLLLDMDTPGITVRPIPSIADDHDFNQVFFEDARVPVSGRLGEEDQGWSVAKYLLEFERAGAFAASLKVGLARLVHHASTLPSGAGGPLITEPSVRRQLALLATQVTAVEASEDVVLAHIMGGGNPGPAASLLKIQGTEAEQALQACALSMAGDYAAVNQFEARQPGSPASPLGPEIALTALPSYLNGRAASIYGGSNEIQRNIIAKAVLGL